MKSLILLIFCSLMLSFNVSKAQEVVKSIDQNVVESEDCNSDDLFESIDNDLTSNDYKYNSEVYENKYTFELYPYLNVEYASKSTKKLK